MEIYDFSVAPGAVAEIHCEGSYAYFSAGSAGGADATISLKHDAAGSRVLLLPGQGFRMGEGQVGRRWLVSNYAGAATIAGRLVIGSGAIDDNRITGSVEVIDGGKNRTLANAVFYGYGYKGGVAGQFSFVQLWNPAASGKRIVLGKITCASATAGQQITHLVRHNAALGALESNPPSKLFGGAASVMELRAGSYAAASGTNFADVYMPDRANITTMFTEPVVIPPGFGVHVDGAAVNMAVSANFEFYEEAV